MTSMSLYHEISIKPRIKKKKIKRLPGVKKRALDLCKRHHHGSQSWKGLLDVIMSREKCRQVVSLMFPDTPHGDHRATRDSNSVK